MNRNIKLGNFGWYEKGAMQKIESLPFKQQSGCKLIYIAICSFSAKQKNTSEIECYKFDISRFASVSEKTVQRYLPELQKLDIIHITPQDRLSNGKYQKVVIRLRNNNLPDGHIGESCGKVVGKLLDTESDIIKESKESKESKEIHTILEIIQENLDFEIQGKDPVIEKWFLELEEHIKSIGAIQTPSKLAEIILNRVIGDNYWLTNLKTVEGLVGNWRAIMRVDEAIGEQKEATIEEMEEVVEETKENPFDIFWKLYPKKKGKGNAEKAWKKLGNPTEKIELIQQALVWQMESEDWIKDGGQYIPYPASYLNGKYWEDEESKPLERNWKKMTHDQAKKIMDGKDGKLQEDLMFNNPKLWNQLAQS